MPVRSLIRIFGLVLFIYAFLCLPVSSGAHPYALTTAFSALTRTGRLLPVGIVLVIVGAILFIISFIGSSSD